ncbi:hypothetical protein Tco_1061172 [Tanacetum coccineum]
MAVINNVPHLVDKKEAEGDDKPESQWTPDKRRVVVQDQRHKSIIIFEGPSDTKENRIMDLKLEYQTFRAKPTESLSQTYTRYKTLLNELANDFVNLSKYEINVGFVNSLPEKWLIFSQGLRNANHTQTLDLADIYGRERIKELELRTQRRNNLEEEFFKDTFPTEEELAYHKELLVNFMILEDLGSVIDGRLSEVVLGKPFVQASKLTYDESLGLIRFSYRDDEVVFRMPQRTKELDLVSPLEKDKFEAFFVKNLKFRKKGFKHVLEKRKGYYKACMNLGRTYKRDRDTIEKLKTNQISIIKFKE